MDVVVVGSGPNGLAAAITAARAGRSVVVLEGSDRVGGACASAELTKPGYVHDVGSAIHPLALASPFMTSIPWADHGLEWVQPPAAAAQPLDGGGAGVVWRDLDRTADGLGADGDAYRRMYRPMVEHFDELIDFSMRPLVRPPRPTPFLARTLPRLALPASVVARAFSTDAARGIFAGHAAHSILPLHRPVTGGFGLLFGTMAHAVGWPFPRGGAGEITRVLAEVLTGLGGRIETGHRVASVADLPPSDAVVHAVTPGQLLTMVGSAAPAAARRRWRRFRYGPGVCKVDYATSAPIPWAHPDVGAAGTVHLGGTFEELAEAEAEVAAGRHADRPFVLLAQHTAFDPSRAPAGGHTVWAYCHVPNGSTIDVSETIDRQIERFAPGFADTVVARRVTLTPELEATNANLIGGDVGGGSYSWHRAVLRPWPALHPYRTGLEGHFIGSASTAPGAGVHGMAGHRAALAALRYLDGNDG